MIIELSLPPACLSPNGRAHWAKKHQATKRYRELAYYVARQALGRADPPRWAEATEQATFYFTSNRRRDQDNLIGSLKAAFDGIADAGIVADDCGLSHLRPIIIVNPATTPRVVIEIVPD